MMDLPKTELRLHCDVLERGFNVSFASSQPPTIQLGPAQSFCTVQLQIGSNIKARPESVSLVFSIMSSVSDDNAFCSTNKSSLFYGSFINENECSLYILSSISHPIDIIVSKQLATGSRSHHQRVLCQIPIYPSFFVNEYFHESLATRLWDCSLVLLYFLLKHHDVVKNQRVLELGSGCGIIGLASLLFGATKVCCTELDDVPMTNLKENIVSFGKQMNLDSKCLSLLSLEQFEWGQDNVSNNILICDLVLAADVLYNTSSHDALLKTLDRILSLDPLSKGLIAYKRRSDSEAIFFEKASFFFDYKIIFEFVNVRIFEFTSKRH